MLVVAMIAIIPKTAPDSRMVRARHAGLILLLLSFAITSSRLRRLFET